MEQPIAQIIFCCGRHVSTHDSLLQHLNEVHFDGNKLKEGCPKWECFHPNCRSEITVKSGVMRHINRKHAELSVYYKVNYHNYVGPNVNPEVNVVFLDNPVNPPDNDLPDDFPAFELNEMEVDPVETELANSPQPNIAFDEVLIQSVSGDSLNNVQTQCVEKLLYILNFVRTSMKDFIFIINFLCTFLLNNRDIWESIARQLVKLTSSTYRFTNAIHKYTFRFFEFAELLFSVNDEPAKVYYFPLESIVKQYFRNKQLCSAILKDHHKTSNSKTIELRLELFFDDFSPIDGLSCAAKRNGISAVYLTVHNVPYRLQSKRKDINLMLLAYRHL